LSPALAALAVITGVAGVAGCDDEPALPPAWAIGVKRFDAQALGLVDAAHPAPPVPALAELTDHPSCRSSPPTARARAPTPTSRSIRSARAVAC